MMGQGEQLQPTYSVDEIIEKLGELDKNGLELLMSVITEEKGRYSLVDLNIIKDMYEIIYFLR